MVSVLNIFVRRCLVLRADPDLNLDYHTQSSFFTIFEKVWNILWPQKHRSRSSRCLPPPWI